MRCTQCLRIRCCLLSRLMYDWASVLSEKSTLSAVKMYGSSTKAHSTRPKDPDKRPEQSIVSSPFPIQLSSRSVYSPTASFSCAGVANALTPFFFGSFSGLSPGLVTLASGALRTFSPSANSRCRELFAEYIG